MRVLRILMLLQMFGSLGWPATIRVPKDQPTIEDGINAANNGDLILVAPGTYVENVNFLGKDVTVKSSRGPKVTIIDGNNQGSVVTFDSDEGPGSILSGFTIRNGNATGQFGDQGGGILIAYASPVIKDNIVINNSACNQGGGTALIIGAPLIQENTISKNSQSQGCDGGPGGNGIYIQGGTGAQILRNTIVRNSGGAVELLSAGSPLLEDNTIAFNTGGAITIQNDSNPIIVQNLIYRNQGYTTGGIYLSPSEGTAGTIIVSNTMVDDGGTQGTELFAGGFDDNSQIINNLFVSTSGLNVVYCDPTYDKNAPTFTYNDAFTTGTPVGGTCAGDIGNNSNISANPKFVDLQKHNYRVKRGSPVIKAGTISAPDLPTKDFAGNPRIVDGTIDIGAYEYQGNLTAPETPR